MLIISEANRESSLNQCLCLTISIIRLLIFWRHPRNPIMHVYICVCWKWYHPCLHTLKWAYLLAFVCFVFTFSPFHRWYTDWWSPKAYATNYTPSTESACVLSCSDTMLVPLRQGTAKVMNCIMSHCLFLICCFGRSRFSVSWKGKMHLGICVI